MYFIKKVNLPFPIPPAVIMILVTWIASELYPKQPYN